MIRRSPLSAVPLLLEAMVVGVLIGLRRLPADGGTVIAGAAFPFDIYFDLKHWMSSATSWATFLVAILGAVIVRSAVLGVTWRLYEGRPGAVRATRRVLPLALRAAILLFPAAGVMFAAAATRYAPFVWAAAALGLLLSFPLTRRATALDVGGGSPGIGRLPEIGAVLSYALLLAAASAALSVLGKESVWLAAGFVTLLGPINAAFLLGCRDYLERGTSPGDGRIAIGLVAAGVIGMFAVTFYDRAGVEPGPGGNARFDGSLLLLGGADSTSGRGPLTELDPRAVGYRTKDTTVLSYRGEGKPYRAQDTRRSLEASSRAVAPQIAGAQDPVRLLGHSQAALILDRIEAEGLNTPERAAVIGGPPPAPSSVDVPRPDGDGRGRVGGDFTRMFSALLDVVGGTAFDIDAPAAPTRIRPVVDRDGRTPRLALWALGDSVVLDTDWRRTGEVNVVVLSDHVGATRNRRALGEVRRWFAGRGVPSDDSSWRSWLVNAYRYAFEPWRP